MQKKKFQIVPAGYLRFQTACESVYFEYFSKKRPYLLHRLNVDPTLLGLIKASKLGRTSCMDTPQYLERLRNQYILQFGKYVQHRSKEEYKERPLRKDMIGVDHAVNVTDYNYILNVTTPDNQHINYLIEDRILEVDILTLLYSAKIPALLQLQKNGRTINIPQEAWANGELEYKLFHDNGRLALESDDCTKIYTGTILLAKEALNTACNEIIGAYLSNQEENVPVLEKKLKPNQRHRERCRAIAAMLWARTPDIPIAQMADCDAIINFGCEGKVYADDETVRNWIKDLHPNPQVGRPKKKIPA